MKILIISDAWHPQVNGVVRTYEHIRDEIIKLGHDVEVIGPSDFPRTYPMPGYSEIRIPLMPYRKLKSLIKDYAPDSIHISTEGTLGWAARKYCIKHNIEFTTSYHTHFPDYTAKRVARYLPFLEKPVFELAKKVMRHFHKPAKAMMVATQSLEEELRSWGFKTPIHRLTRGVNLQQFYPGEKTLFHDLKQPIALYVGRVAIEKNLEDFLSMDWEGDKIIVGDGPSLQTLSEKYPHAIFAGKKSGEELAAYYRSSDIFIFPSRTDTFGIVLIEALATGLPVAAYNVTGPKDIITESFLGALHDSTLSEAATTALSCGSPEQRADFVKNLYTWEKTAQQFLKSIQ